MFISIISWLISFFCLFNFYLDDVKYGSHHFFKYSSFSFTIFFLNLKTNKVKILEEYDDKLFGDLFDDPIDVTYMSSVDAMMDNKKLTKIPTEKAMEITGTFEIHNLCDPLLKKNQFQKVGLTGNLGNER